jgi:hypothetical protein
MSRVCRTCQHLKRAEIDRRLAAGEPAAQLAHDYALNPSSLYRHRANCLKLGSSNAIMKDAARGTAAVALLPSKESLSGAYLDLRNRIDQIVAQAQQAGSLAVAVSGLNSLRQTLDSLGRLAGHVGSAAAQVNVAIQNNVNVNVEQIAERLISQFDNEPDVKARIGQALLRLDDQTNKTDRTSPSEVTVGERCHEYTA